MAFPFYENAVVALPFDGANNGTIFPDWSYSPKTLAAIGNAKTVTSQSKYYGSSVYFDGAGDGISLAGMPSNANLFGDLTNPITIEFWIFIAGRNTATSYPTIYTVEQSANYRYTIFYTGVSPVVHFTSYINAVFQGISAGAVLLNTWTHIAFVNEGSKVFKSYKNGVFNATTTFTQALAAGATVNHRIGNGYNYEDCTQGNLQDFLITYGAKYTSDFTPPTRIIGEISNSATTPILDSAGLPMQAPVHCTPITGNAPSRVFSTICDASGNFTLRAPAAESDVIIENIEATVYENKLISKVTPV